jgi:hypothetical protein
VQRSTISLSIAARVGGSSGSASSSFCRIPKAALRSSRDRGPERGGLGLPELGLHEPRLLVGGPGALVHADEEAVRLAGQPAGLAVPLLGLTPGGEASAQPATDHHEPAHHEEQAQDEAEIDSAPAAPARGWRWLGGRGRPGDRGARRGDGRSGIGLAEGRGRRDRRAGEVAVPQGWLEVVGDDRVELRVGDPGQPVGDPDRVGPVADGHHQQGVVRTERVDSRGLVGELRGGHLSGRSDEEDEELDVVLAKQVGEGRLDRALLAAQGPGLVRHRTLEPRDVHGERARRGEEQGPGSQGERGGNDGEAARQSHVSGQGR